MTERKVKLASESKTIMTEMIMPNDTNPLGNLMGGYLMCCQTLRVASSHSLC